MRRSRLSLASGARRARLDGSVAAGKSRRWVPFLSESLPNAAIGLPKTSKALQFPAKNCNSLPGIWTYQGLTGGGKKKNGRDAGDPFLALGLASAATLHRPGVGQTRQDWTRGAVSVATVRTNVEHTSPVWQEIVDPALPRSRAVPQAGGRQLAGGPGLVIVRPRRRARVRGGRLTRSRLCAYGGEIAALAVLDACVRFIPGVMGKSASKSKASNRACRNIRYTRPREWEGRHSRRLADGRSREGGGKRPSGSRGKGGRT